MSGLTVSFSRQTSTLPKFALHSFLHQIQSNKPASFCDPSSPPQPYQPPLTSLDPRGRQSFQYLVCLRDIPAFPGIPVHDVDALAALNSISAASKARPALKSQHV